MSDKSSVFWEFVRKTVHLSGLLTVIVYTLLLNYFNEQVAILVLTGGLLVMLEI